MLYLSKKQADADPYEVMTKRITSADAGGMPEEEVIKNMIPSKYHNILEGIKQFIRDKDRVINPEIFGIIDKLRKMHKVVMMNNEILEWNEFRKEKFELPSHFDEIFSSCDLGLAKPYPEFFKAVLKRLKIAPSELAFIDDKSDNVASAAELGINTILFTDVVSLKVALSNLLAHSSGSGSSAQSL